MPLLENNQLGLLFCGVVADVAFQVVASRILQLDLGQRLVGCLQH